MRSTAGSSSSPSREDWFISRAILPSAQSDAPVNIRIPVAHASACSTSSSHRNTGTSASRITLSTLGTVSTRLRSGGRGSAMGRTLAENPRQAQSRHCVVGQWVVVHHVRSRRRRPRQLRQVESGLLFQHICGLERLLRRLDGVGRQGCERVDGHPVKFVERVLPAERAQVDALPDVSQIGEVIGPPAVEVIQHDQPADALQLLLAEVLRQLLVALWRPLLQLLTSGRGSQQRGGAFPGDRPLARAPRAPRRPARPGSCLPSPSVWGRPVPITCRPPSSATSSWSASSDPPSRMSVPRPAICVDTVTAPSLPASAMIRASSAPFFG